ncbi:hypothetical protein AB0B44_33675, partial [Streptomyces sp. NPDC041003]
WNDDPLSGPAWTAARHLWKQADFGPQDVDVAHPTALADFPRDNFIPLRHVAARTDTIVRWTSYDRGGHFPAMEVPELLVGDVRAFFRQLRQLQQPRQPRQDG